VNDVDRPRLYHAQLELDGTLMLGRDNVCWLFETTAVGIELRRDGRWTRDDCARLSARAPQAASRRDAVRGPFLTAVQTARIISEIYTPA
jgi:hypothetical protein